MFWGQGYAREAGCAIIRHPFQRFDVPSVTAEIDHRNHASIELVKRLGFLFVRHSADIGNDIFEITRGAWLSGRPAAGAGKAPRAVER